MRNFNQTDTKRINEILAGVALLVLVSLCGSLLFWQVSAAQPLLGPAAPEPDATVNLLAVGDISLGRGVQQSADASPERADYPFSQIKNLTSNVDIAFANLESPLVSPQDAAHPQTQGYQFPGRPSDAVALKKAGFSLVTLANNHSLDYGTVGLQGTITALQQAGVQYVGAGANKTEAEATRYLAIHGLKIAFIAATQAWPNALDPNDKAAANVAPVSLYNQNRLLQQIKTARTQADVVIVALHWGEEYSQRAADWQQQFVQAASAAGADLILGAHPHVLQPFDVVGHTVVAYSLGNFIFDSGWPPETKQSAALFVKLDKQGVAEAQVVPLKIVNNRPVPLQPAERADGLANLAKLTPLNSLFTAKATFWDGQQWQSSAALDYVRDKDATNQIVLPQSRTIQVEDITGPSPGFATGLSSLLYANAPKVPERIQLDNHSLRIWRQDAQNRWQVVWQSPPDWTVMQFTFGDADEDGRPEIMFSLWKNTGWDDAGTYRSHPFVYGWRNVTNTKTSDQTPAIRPVWAGSKLADPFREFALSDFKDGTHSTIDGAHNQLAVLQGSYAEGWNAPAHSLIIFSWNGWGYENDYQTSTSGNYAALNYAPGQPYVFYKYNG